MLRIIWPGSIRIEIRGHVENAYSESDHKEKADKSKLRKEKTRARGGYYSKMSMS